MRRGATIVAALLAVGAVHAQQPIADIRQGTNIGLAVAPDGAALVIDLLGQLWTLPSAGGGAEPLTPTGETARNPRYSPDGSRVVYQRLRDGRWDLWLVELGSGEQRALTETPYDEREPDFTADGRSIVFASNRTGHYCLWSQSLDGGIATQLTEEPGDASFPSVSSDGLVAYVLDRNAEFALRVLAADGVGTTVHTSAHELYAPSWRPGGGVLVFGEQEAGSSASGLRMLLLGEPRVMKTLTGSGEDVFRTRPGWASPAEFIYAADGQLWRRGIANPVRRPVHLFAALAIEARPPPADIGPLDEPGARPALGINHTVWSADGRRATFTALGDVWLYERGDAERLTDDASFDLDPVFWPDDESVVFASERTGQFELWRIALRDRRPTQLTFGALQAHAPAVSPDGRYIAFLETDGSGPPAATRLALLDVRNGRGEPVTAALDLVDATQPEWTADGALRVRAKSVRSAVADAPVRVEIATDDARPALGTTRADPAVGAARDAPQPTIEVPWEPQPRPAPYVVQVGRLFDGVRGDYRRHVDVHVIDGRIAAIVSRGVLPTPARVIDARDSTVIPGLVDVHAHQSSLAGERLGRTWLAYGVTTVRETGADAHEALERGEAWAAGRSPGPRLVVTPAADTAAAVGVGRSNAVPLRSYLGIADGFRHSLSLQTAQLGFPRGATADTTTATPAGRYELEVSASYAAYQDGFARLIASGTVFTPTFGALGGLAAAPNVMRPAAQEAAYGALFSAVERAQWSHSGNATIALPALQRTVARLIRGGGRVAVGSDAPAVPYGLGMHVELALLVDAGIANDQVLRLATAEGALALGLERQIGTLEDGKLADFVVLDGDPLARIGDTTRITAVVKGGDWFDRESLLTPR